jgi:hypothetical protein
MKIPWCGCPKSFWQYLAYSTFASAVLGPWRFLRCAMKRQCNAFNDLHLTRLEINLLVNLSHSMWNNRTGGDVTFLVGEHIKGTAFHSVPEHPRVSQAARSLQIRQAEGERGRKHEQTHWIFCIKWRYSNLLLIWSHALHYTWLFNIQV